MNNAENFEALRQALSEFKPDSIIITGSASPEGPPAYNRALAQRRANSAADYIYKNYGVDPSVCHVRIYADEEYWTGLIELVESDPNVPSKEEFLKMMTDPQTSDNEKSRMLTRMKKGEIFNYLRRKGTLRPPRQSAIEIIFPSVKKVSMPESEPEPVIVAEPEQEPVIVPVIIPVPVFIPVPMFVTESRTIIEPCPPCDCDPHPFALRTNLLLDLVGGPNIGVEVPIGEHFSVAADFAYAYTRIRNLYVLQTIRGTLEGRYWFKQGKNLLTGWNLGVYGSYCSRFDIQWGYGYQGDGFLSCGLTGGYAVPIGKRLNLDFSVAGGFFHSPEIREYSRPQDGHLIWEKTRYNVNRIALTQVRINLVWLFNTKSK